ncbi:hypothetical protein [Nonomuraea sp. NPDC050310]|uniref:hypothetical protein n=1 Tax=Nonomuraea sp. NPDC050310 TaxID=3154935 RepID=UPI0033E8AEC8
MRPQPEELIIDPALHRTTEAEQARLEGHLGEEDVHVERGYQPSPRGIVPVSAAAAIALSAGLVAGRRAGLRSRAARTLTRVTGRPSLRLSAVTRTGLATLCGALPGVVIGVTVGMLLVWPATAPVGYLEVPPRGSFHTPWETVLSFAAALPVLAAVMAAPFKTRAK